MIKERVGNLSEQARRVLKRKEWFVDPGIVDRARLFVLPFCPRFLSQRRSAITLGHIIILTKNYKPGTVEGLALLAHELKHVEQYKIWGIFRFLWRYLVEWLKVGYDLDRHPYEKEAYAFQRRVKKRLKEEWAQKQKRAALSTSSH